MKFKRQKVNKIFIVLPIVIMALIFIIFFIKKDNKEVKMGNTIISQTKEQALDYILNIDSYEATAEIEVISNKNKNKYKVIQKYQKPNICIQEVVEPSNIKGLKTIYDGKNLKVENTKLNLSTIYQNYSYLTQNNLWLTSFLEECKIQNNYTCSETKTEWIFQTQKNAHGIKKVLKIDKKTGKPIKLEVQDMNQKTFIYIVYNEIKINNLKGKNILALGK